MSLDAQMLSPPDRPSIKRLEVKPKMMISGSDARTKPANVMAWSLACSRAAPMVAKSAGTLMRIRLIALAELESISARSASKIKCQEQKVIPARTGRGGARLLYLCQGEPCREAAMASTLD